MSFFGAVFAGLTMHWQWHMNGLILAAPFVVFGVITLAAVHVIRLSGDGIIPSEATERAIMWSSIAEGVGLFIVAQLVISLHRADLLLPSMALVVGLHFLPIAFAAQSRPYYSLGTALILSALIGFILEAPANGAIAGLMAALCLWIAATLAVRRDLLAKRTN